MSLALLPNSNSLRILIICDSVNFDLFMTVNLIIYYIFKLSEKWGSLPDEYIPHLDSAYHVYDSMPELNWEITDETENILGFTCKKATVKYRGSSISAYFTEEIPIPFGPWKFDGLPGLILKVISNDYNGISWVATSIQYPYEKGFDFNWDESKYNLSLKEFKFEEFKVLHSKSFDENTSIQKIRDTFRNGRRKFVVEQVYEWEKPGDIWRVYYEHTYNKLAPW